MNVFIIYKGMDLLRMVENWAAPFVLVMTAALLWWAVSRANGIGPLLAEPGKYHTLRVRTHNTAYKVRARSGYVAEPSKS